MQYFKPSDPYFVGDCMPFFHDGTFHLYYLQDEDHHQGKGGLGGHQWAHASTTDLIHWQHHPLAIACEDDWECSICTGSVFYHDGLYYGFYATRLPDRTEKLSLAISEDGITFRKTQPNPFAGPAAGYGPSDYRDPFVFRDGASGDFQMLVTTRLTDSPLYRRGGCLVRLTSKNLRQWDVAGTFLVPGGEAGYPSIPECPDFFEWNGLYYLISSLDAEARYRMSRSPSGPWMRPEVDTFDGPTLASVMKTAAFTGNRRIGVAYLAARRDNQDTGQRLYAGHTAFREIIQHTDGTLGTRFPPELIPARGEPLGLSFTPLTSDVSGSANNIRIDSPEGLGAAALDGMPRNAYIRFTIRPDTCSADFGLWLRGSGSLESGYPLHFLPFQRRVTLNRQAIAGVDGLDCPFTVEIVLRDDIIDVCIDQRRTLIDRSPELNGDRLLFFAQNAQVTFDSIEVRPLV